MTTALWVVQILLAIAFGMAGVMKLMRPKEQLAEQMGWVDDFSQNQVRLIGVAELLAALGLLLPLGLGIMEILTPLAAVGLVILMLGAAYTHNRRGETQMIMMNVVLLLLAAFVVYGRFFWAATPPA